MRIQIETRLSNGKPATLVLERVQCVVFDKNGASFNAERNTLRIAVEGKTTLAEIQIPHKLLKAGELLWEDQA